MSNPHQDLFLRFREQGDVAALGALFDGLAVELFRLALFLAPNASDAEDLVQGTFLSAIESAHAYDESRPLRPWLTGILANLARRRRRDHNRDRPSEIPDGLAATADVDTTGPAERAEIRECFAEAMRCLPQTYRQVLTLHLQEGMTARRIGEVLERPAGTVRSQVVRGLELLRKAMPASVAGALAVTFSAGHALAGVRIDVLRAAADYTPAASASGATGSTLGGSALRMAPFYVVSTAAILLAGLAWICWYAPNSEVPPPVSSKVSAIAPPVAQPSEELPSPRPPDNAGPERSPAAAAAATAIALKVQLVDGEGTAQPGLTCRVVRAGEELELFAIGCARDGSSRMKSDANGWISFEGNRGGVYQAWIVGTETRRRFSLPNPAAAAGVSWRVPAAHTIRGYVRAPNGTALAGMDVYASASASSRDVAVPVAQSSHDGSFAFRLAAAQSFVWAARDGLCSHVFATTDATVELVALPAAGTLQVTVLAPSGKPAVRAVVAGFSDAPGGALWPVVFAVTDDHGAVRLSRLPVGDIVVVARNGEDNSKRRSVAVNSGATSSITLQLDPGATVTGCVVDLAGSPVRGCAVYAQVRQLRANSFDGRLYDRVARTDREGNYVLTGLPRGDIRLRLIDSGARRELHSKSVQLGIGEQRQLDWQVGQRQLRGRVVGVSDPTSYSITATAVDASGRAILAYRFVESLDANGIFTMLVPPRFSAVCLHVARADSPSPLVFYNARVVVRDLAKPIKIDVEPTASGCTELTATFVEKRDRGAKVTLVRTGVNTANVIGSDGHMTFAGVAVGEYSLRIERVDGFVWARVIEVIKGDDSFDLGNLSAKAEGVLVVEAQGRVSLQLRNSRDCTIRNVALATTTSLEAGNYTLLVHGADAVPQAIPITIQAGEETRRIIEAEEGVRCTFEFPFNPLDNTTDILAGLSIAVFDTSGSVVVDGVIPNPNEDVYEWRQTLAPGVYRLEAVAAWGGVASGTVRVDGNTPVNWTRELSLR
jgi:RNA polymerase sigma factor (sigma-70 family)